MTDDNKSKGYDKKIWGNGKKIDKQDECASFQRHDNLVDYI